nr:hypothetical protein [Tanacetum cinerariifolium]
KALVKRDAPDKLDPRSINCIFIGYPKETMGYCFYYPPENKIFIARNAEFFENSLIVQEASGSHGLLKMKHNEVVPIEVEPQNVKVPIRRSVRIPQAPDRYGLYADVDEYELGDLNEPPNYKAALSDPEYDKWLEAMNTEMQSMKDNELWILVKVPPNGRTFGSKWIFKKKYDMDDNIRFTQNTDELCVYLKASGSIVAFLILYVDDILLTGNNVTMLQEVKYWLCKCFSMKDLGEATYILGIKIIRDRSKQLIALSQSAYLEKILKKFRMENSKKGYTPMMEKPDYRKSQGVKTPSKVQRMQRVPYDLVVGSIMYAVRCTRLDVAFVQNLCSHFQQNPGEIHWTVVKTILKYLRNTKDMVLVYEAKPKAELKVSCYADAKSEYIVAAEASMEALWMRKLVDGLGNVMPSNKRRMEMLCDDEPVIAIAADPGILKGAKHFQRKYHYIREVIQEREIILKKFTQMTT